MDAFTPTPSAEELEAKASAALGSLREKAAPRSAQEAAEIGDSFQVARAVLAEVAAARRDVKRPHLDAAQAAEVAFCGEGFADLAVATKEAAEALASWCVENDARQIPSASGFGRTLALRRKPRATVTDPTEAARRFLHAPELLAVLAKLAEAEAAAAKGEAPEISGIEFHTEFKVQ